MHDIKLFLYKGHVVFVSGGFVYNYNDDGLHWPVASVNLATLVELPIIFECVLTDIYTYAYKHCLSLTLFYNVRNALYEVMISGNTTRLDDFHIIDINDNNIAIKIMEYVDLVDYATYSSEYLFDILDRHASRHILHSSDIKQ